MEDNAKQFLGLHDFTSFPALADEFRNKVGGVGAWALGIGLFAAGFSSAITSPYAASIIASNVLGAQSKNSIRWVWGTVLLIGFLFGIFNDFLLNNEGSCLSFLSQAFYKLGFCFFCSKTGNFF